MKNLNVLFHIESKDYFGTLATVLSLIRQGLESPETNSTVLEKCEKDLIFLQENYDIIPKVKTE